MRALQRWFDIFRPGAPIEPPLDERLFAEPWGRERRRMVEKQLWGRDIKDRRLLEAMARVPRHLFVAEDRRGAAYDDAPIGIGHGQTISQPYMVAKMTLLAQVGAGSRVLEIGAGSGYQTAVLLELGAEVHALEIVEPLAGAAADRLRALGYRHFALHCRDGYAGLPEVAPFAAILLAAAPEFPPAPLLEQLAPGGRLIAPVGPLDDQQLYVYTRTACGIEPRCCFPVRFVPMTGRAREAADLGGAAAIGE